MTRSKCALCQLELDEEEAEELFDKIKLVIKSYDWLLIRIEEIEKKVGRGRGRWDGKG